MQNHFLIAIIEKFSNLCCLLKSNVIFLFKLSFYIQTFSKIINIDKSFEGGKGGGGGGGQRTNKKQSF
jgi:hypothetical protein